MKVSEILKEQEPTTLAPKLVQVLRTLISQADQRGEKLFLHFAEPKASELQDDAKNIDLNRLMANVGGEQFDYETFKAAYDTDNRVKTMIRNFSEKGIEPKTKEEPNDLPQADSQDGGKSVSQMAKSATNLGDKL